MLATLAAEPFSKAGWIFEPKLDGIRCLIFRNNQRVELLSRNRRRLNDAYPELIAPILKQKPKSFVMDGEIVAFSNGLTSFARLQQRMQIRDPHNQRRSGVDVFYYAFDLPFLAGHDLRALPLLERKELLTKHFRFTNRIRFSEHREREGTAYFRHACKKGWEGLIAKRAGGPYVSARSRDWLKFKCSAEQEFVVVGYTDPKGTRAGFGALLLGYYDRSRLTFAGKVGTGFDTRILLDLRKKMDQLQRAQAPPGVNKNHRVHWIKPKLVVQVSFTEWTRDGKLRHPTFVGLRNDKPAQEIMREKPA